MDTIISANDLVGLVREVGKGSSPEVCEKKVGDMIESQIVKEKETQNAKKV